MHLNARRVLLAATAIGLAAGAGPAWRYLAARFPWVALDSLRGPLLTSLGLGLLFLAGFGVLRALARWTKRSIGTTPLAWLAALPVWIAVGLICNRRWAIRPAEFLTGFSLRRNGLLLAGLALATGVLVFWLTRRQAPGGAKRSRWLPWATLVVVWAAILVLPRWLPALASPSPNTSSQPPVLLILIDALRADGIGLVSGNAKVSPALDAFANDSVVFTQAISQSTFTRTSIASLFTGEFPFRHGVYQGGQAGSGDAVRHDLLGEEWTTLAERFRARGYLTEAWVQNSQILGRMGFGQGFLNYRDQQGPSARLNRSLLRWLGGPGAWQPFFGYVHFIDLHDPYRPQPPYDRMFGATENAYRGLDLAAWGATLEKIRAGKILLTAEQVVEMRRLYDGLIRTVDDALAELFARLKAAGLYDRMTIVVTADHGDAFYEHGTISHSTAPYEELVRVPLLVKFPGRRFAGTRVGAQVRLIDVAPTLLEIAGAAGGDPWRGDGCSLVPLARGGAERQPGCELAVVEIAEDDAAPTIALRTETWKYMLRRGKDEELYSLQEDAAETRNRIADSQREAATLRALAARFVAQRGKAREAQSVDEGVLRDLRNLGYIR